MALPLCIGLKKDTIITKGKMTSISPMNSSNAYILYRNNKILRAAFMYQFETICCLDQVNRAILIPYTLHPTPYALFTVTLPFLIYINTGNYHHTSVSWCKNNSYMLIISCITFQSIFGVGF